MKRYALISVFMLAASSGIARAEEQLSTALNESVIKLPTTVSNIFNQVITKDMVVTQFRPHGEGFRSQFYCMDVVIKIALNQAANVFCRPQNILLTVVLPFGYRHVLDMVSQELSLILNTRALVRVKNIYLRMKLRQAVRLM